MLEFCRPVISQLTRNTSEQSYLSSVQPFDSHLGQRKGGWSSQADISHLQTECRELCDPICQWFVYPRIAFQQFLFFLSSSSLNFPRSNPESTDEPYTKPHKCWDKNPYHPLWITKYFDLRSCKNAWSIVSRAGEGRRHAIESLFIRVFDCLLYHHWNPVPCQAWGPLIWLRTVHTTISLRGFSLISSFGLQTFFSLLKMR